MGGREEEMRVEENEKKIQKANLKEWCKETEDKKKSETKVSLEAQKAVNNINSRTEKFENRKIPQNIDKKKSTSNKTRKLVIQNQVNPKTTWII